MHFLHPDHFPVTQIEVKIYFWFIWVAFEQQKWQKKNLNRKLSFWRWDSNVPKILNSVIPTIFYGFQDPMFTTLYQPRGDCFKNAGSPCRMIFWVILNLILAGFCFPRLGTDRPKCLKIELWFLLWFCKVNILNNLPQVVQCVKLLNS